jgi:hypothetical protein
VLAALAAMWGVVAILVSPDGEFPLNDDWAYSLPVKWLIEEHRLRFTAWQSHPLIVQVLWGALFALPWGFSFTALRWSTLVLGGVTIAATYIAARELGVPRRVSGLVAALLLANPLFVSLSSSFMSDVPNMAFGMIAIALFLGGLRTGRAPLLGAGWVAVLTASLIRQPTLAIAIGMAVAMAWHDGVGRRWALLGALPAMLVVLIVVVVYPWAMDRFVGLPALYNLRTSSALELLYSIGHLRLGALKPALRSLGLGLLNAGLWLLPLTVWMSPTVLRTGSRRSQLAVVSSVVVGTCALTAILAHRGLLMPLGDPGNILVDFGAGVRTLRGEPPHAPRVLWTGVTAAAVLGSVLLVAALLRVVSEFASPSNRDQRRRSHTVLIVSTAVLCYAPASLNYGAWFDRYTLMLIPLLGSIIGTLRPAGVRGVSARRAPLLCGATGCALAAVFAVFAVTATRDYLAWNRARAEACRDLVSTQDGRPDLIDCGFELNNLLAVSAAPVTSAAALVQRDNARYAISFGPLPGYEIVRSTSCEHRLPYGIVRVAVLRKSE